MKTASILFIMCPIVCVASDHDYSAAGSKALQAAYIQSGLSERVDTYAKYLDNKYVPDEYRNEGATALILIQCTVKQQVSWKWSF